MHALLAVGEAQISETRHRTSTTKCAVVARRSSAVMWRAVLAAVIASVADAVVSNQGHVRTEFDEMYGLITNGFIWHSHPELSNFVMWNGTQPGRDRAVVLCSMMKVGSSTFQALGFDKMPKSAATKALLDARQVRAIVVRNPIDRFMSWHNDKIVHGSTAQVAAYNSLLLQQRSTVKHPALLYAEAIGRRPQGAWDLEYHLTPMSRMCHLGILQYDVVGDLADLPSFWQALDELDVSLPCGVARRAGGTGSGTVGVQIPRLPRPEGLARLQPRMHSTSCNTTRINSKTHAREEEIGCSLYHALVKIYRQDLHWLRKLTSGRHSMSQFQLRLTSPPANCTQSAL